MIEEPLMLPARPGETPDIRHTKTSRRAAARVRRFGDARGRRSARAVPSAFVWSAEARQHLAQHPSRLPTPAPIEMPPGMAAALAFRI